MPSTRTQYTVREAARQAGISAEVLALWISVGKFKPSGEATVTYTDRLSGQNPDLARKALYAQLGSEPFTMWFFTNEDIEGLRSIVESTAKKRTEVENSHKSGTHYSVQELASLWGLSTDKVRELFENEAGVIVIGHNGTRRKRGYRTLRIPEPVAARVQRRMANL